MKHNIGPALVVTALTGFAMLAEAQTVSGPRPHYTVINLGTLGGSQSNGYAGVTNNGWVAGDSFLGRVGREPADATEHADMISIMLMSFPHLFPPSTNQWQPNVDRDPATDTVASPDLWRNFSDFYQRAQAASKLALDATRAKTGNEFKGLIVQLRAACNTCHAAYMKTE